MWGPNCNWSALVHLLSGTTAVVVVAAAVVVVVENDALVLLVAVAVGSWVCAVVGIQVSAVYVDRRRRGR